MSQSTQNMLSDLKVADAQCTALWEEDFHVDENQKDADGVYRARSHCTYGCGCHVGYQFVYADVSIAS